MTGASENRAKSLLLAGLIGGIAGAAIAAATLTLQSQTDRAPLEDLLAQQSQFEKLVKQQMADLSDAQSVLAEQSDLKELSERLSLIENDSEVSDALVKIREEVAHLEELYRAEITSLRGARAKTAAAALALREIDAAIDSGQPFATALEQLTAIMDDDATLRELAMGMKPYANGVASLERLANELDTIRIDAIHASGANAGSWVGRTVENLRALIDVEGLPELKGIDGRLRDAREKTILDQMPTVITELADIQEDVPALGNWLTKARARQAAVTLLAALDRHLDERVSRQG